MDEFKILLQAILDTENIKADIGKVQKVADKYRINFETEIDQESAIKQVKQLWAKVATDFNKTSSVKIPVELDDALLSKSLKQAYSEIDKISSKAQNIKINVDLGNYEAKIASYESSLNKMGKSAEEVENYMKGVKNAYSELKASTSSDKIIPDNIVKNAKTLESEMQKLVNTTKQVKFADSLVADDSKVERTIIRLNEQLRKNTAYSKEAKQAINAWISELSKGNVAESRLEKINLEAQKLHSSMASLGKIGFNNIDKLENAWSKFGGWTIATGTFMAVGNKFREIPEAVYDIDTAMTNLYKVTDETNTKYNEFLDSAKTKAQELGRTVSGLVDQTSEWAKLGFNLDDASKLAQNSAIYANVGEVDDTTAVKDMVSALKAFNIEASDSIQIVDKLNILGNNFATSSADLGKGLRNSASALALAGNDINKSLAMLTGGTEITQNASEMGNALKVLSMRIRGRHTCLHIGKVYMPCCA